MRLGLKDLFLALGIVALPLISIEADAEDHEGHSRCGTAVVSKADKIKAAARMELSDLIHGSKVSAFAASIPIYYHIIQSSNGDNSATEEQMLAQTALMNKAYAGTGFTFTQAGVDETVNDLWFDGITPDSSEESEMKAALKQGGSDALNVYLTKPGNNLLGWATFPWYYEDYPTDDGVVMSYATLPGGATESYNRGGTLVHEGGHWLGLYHTFEPGSGTSGCKGKGDYVSDTPAQKEAQYECKKQDTCKYKKGKPAGWKGNDAKENYMNYTPDACMTKFSKGQKSRAVSAFNAYRAP